VVLKLLANFAKNNLKYILLNNNAHDSVGGQSTYSNNIDFNKFSKSIGFKKFVLIKNKLNLKNKLEILFLIKIMFYGS
jgi:phosphonopyruvate decarboxylase